jgi:uncharacterized protein
MTRTPYFPPGSMPLPAITDDTRPFWDGCRRRQLLVQRCTACASPRHPPSPVCWRCRSFAHEWVAASGQGTVFTYAVVHRAFQAGLETHVPYTLVVVALDDVPGVRLVSNLVDADAAELRVGLPVQVLFEDVSAEVTVPRFQVRRA